VASVISRFHSEAEPKLDYDVLLPVDDNSLLSIEEYRQILYEVIECVIRGRGPVSYISFQCSAI
jgi:hypothetical protein